MSKRSTKPLRAAIMGASGYGGGEIARRLFMHPEVELVRIASVDFIDEPLETAHPNLLGISTLRFEDISPTEAARDCDVVLLGLPHSIAATNVPELIALGVKIVDMSGDFRLTNIAAYERYYDTTHPCPNLVKQFVYGLPELRRNVIRNATCVASPGCFATSIELALLPLATAGLLSGTVYVHGITGSSGSGTIPSASTHHPVRNVNLKTYKPLVHQHTPEIVETLAAAGARNLQLRFVPTSAPLSRGILATAFAEIDAHVSEDDIAKLFDDAYANEPFVRRPTRRGPEVAAVAGSNYVEVGFALAEPTGPTRTIACFAALDNLVKGGAGQAVQNMNLMLGLDETLSLQDPGSWP